MKISELKQKKWLRLISNKYVLILLLFVIWMFFFDTNSFLIHNELNHDVNALEDNKEFYKKEIKNDKVFIERMKDSEQIEKFAREKYYLKKEKEDIFIIENEDSLKKKKKDE
ncbi:FtsB family cell division protein [Ulvibacter antarcticus]|uniref:Septum formation initiator n=1 Tax=Ulvibacter antarcticus TaxID=442714 RepID=A0A3L9YYF7_9FLAO|nr:septum formation initiator family protein [Ulvibacter antarcticus]RMA64837.1 septum formation initiator [Ulvibacter antarcticus]